jgi:hypothetical protein
MASASLKTAASLSAILFAVAAGLGSKAHAQTNATDKHRWLEDCPADRIYSTHNTGSNFSVKVSFHKDPISSVRVLLAREGNQPDERDWPVVATSETDSRGTARFFAIPAGKYKARIDGELLTPASEEIEVDENDATATEINFQWPEKTQATRTLRGGVTVVHNPTKEAIPLQYVLIQLLDLRTARPLARTHSNGEGYFAFPPVGDGLYVVRFSEDQDDASSQTDDIAVEVRPNALEEDMPSVKLEETDCGTRVSRQPDQELFVRAESALEENRRDVASITLQTLINTYPDSPYAAKAKQVLKNSQLMTSDESFSFFEESDEGTAASCLKY